MFAQIMGMPGQQDDERYRPGDRVVRRSQREAVGVVVGASRRLGKETWYPVQFGAVVDHVLDDDLTLYLGEIDLEGQLRQGVFASNTALTRRVTMSKLRRPLRDTLYSLDAARTEFHPHQFKPLLKFISSDRPRLLIADEVGLGKTIEAGYILREQKARHDIDRILVLCPASLRLKWEVELWRRFGERFDVMDSAHLRRALFEQASEGASRRRFHGIASLQTVRSEKMLELLEERTPQLDLLIVDEAHHCRNSATRQHRAVRELADMSEAVLFLTATPLHLRNEDLFNLLRLLLPEEFDHPGVFEDRLRVNEHIVRAETHLRRTDRMGPHLALESLQNIESGWSSAAIRFRENPLYTEVKNRLTECNPDDTREIVDLQDSLSRLNLLSHVMARTKKRDAYPNAPVRDPKTVQVQMNPVEQEIYTCIYDFCAERYTRANGDLAAQFALITLQRQLASSIHAMLEHYAEAIRDARAGSRINDEIDEGDDDTERDEGVKSSGRSLVDDPEFVALINRCMALSIKGQDSRFDKLCTVLAESRKKVVVFATFRRSLRYLEARLHEQGIGCVRVDGSIPLNPLDPDNDERSIRVRKFQTDPTVRVLLSSQVLREGHDLQFCDTLVNWDLPWNPMDVEQRIGRLDRMGQRSEVILIFSFSSPHTVEGRILDRLYTRVGLFEGAIGPLEPILGAQIRELTSQLFNYRLTEEQRAAEIERTALVLQARLRDERTLEQASAGLLGQDEIFQEQLQRVRRLGRYVTPHEVELFVRDYLSHEQPDATLGGWTTIQTYAGPTKWGVLTITPGLRHFVRQSLPVNDAALMRFLERAVNGKERVTFDPSAGLEDPTLELLHSQHPLVKAIAKFYEGACDRIPPTATIAVTTDDIPENDYFFLWEIVSETGLQAGQSMWVEAIRADGGSALSADDAELLLHQAVVRGRRWDFPGVPGEQSLTLLTRCREALARRVLERKAQALRQNAARVDARIASLKASSDVRRREKENRLQSHRLHERASMIRMLDAQLRKLDADFEQKLSELEKGRTVTVSFREEGAGYIHVSKESSI